VLSLTRACKFKFELCTTVPHTVMCTLMTLKRSEHTHDGHSETPNNSFQQLHLLCVSLAHSPTHTHTHKLYSLGSSGTGTKRPPVCSVKSQTSLSRKVLTTLILDVLVSLSYLWLNVPRVSWELPSSSLGAPGLHQGTPWHAETVLWKSEFQNEHSVMLCVCVLTFIGQCGIQHSAGKMSILFSKCWTVALIKALS